MFWLGKGGGVQLRDKTMQATSQVFHWCVLFPFEFFCTFFSTAGHLFSKMSKVSRGRGGGGQGGGDDDLKMTFRLPYTERDR